MDLYVIRETNHTTGAREIIGLIDTFQSLIWNVQYTQLGDLQLVVPATDENLSFLTKNTMLVREIDITPNGYKNVMIIETVKLDFDTEKGYLLTVTGKGLKSIVSRRIVWQQTNLNGPIYSSIATLLNQNAFGNANYRCFPGSNTVSISGTSQSVDLQLIAENLGTWMINAANTYGFGWDVYLDLNFKLTFNLYTGTNRTYNQSAVAPVVFSPENDNLLTSSYVDTIENYYNAGIVGGEGEGTAQKVVDLGSTGTVGLERYETYIDATSLSSNGDIITLQTYLEMLKNYGLEQLSAFNVKPKFDGEIDPNGMYKLNEDYFLGDIVQIENEKGIQATTQIIEIIYAEDENGASTVPTFSEWEVS